MKPLPPAVIVSACLLGLKTRYNGKDALNPELLKSLKDKNIIPVCPEQLGGLPTPRPRCEITNGGGKDVLEGRAQVMDEHGKDVTANFIKGAEEVLKTARLTGALEAVLKENSPSCGVHVISRGGARTKGVGVTTALLKKAGVKATGV
ncbi:MAG: DUF523 domain-containing protein [Deltaproteobacteria bacterium]|nr:DUF523 domain-containing protein [Deltaproteobacteria bacterium]